MAKKRHTYNQAPYDGEREDDLILGQNGQQDEQMTFGDDGNEPDPAIVDKLRRKETPFKKVDFPEKREDEPNFEELLASEEYKDALDKLEQYVGTREVGVGFNMDKFLPLTQQGLMLTVELMRTQIRYADELEQLAEEVVRDYFKIPENALQFNFQLKREPIKVEKPQNQQPQREEEFAEDVNDLTPERAKRRLINAMTQGVSVDEGFIFNKVADRLKRITGDNNVIEKYSIITAMAVLGYWHFPEEMIKKAEGGEMDAGGGKSRLDSTTNPPTVHAEAVIFPFLIHEGIKGVMEFLGKERNPEDEEKYQKAMELEDQIQHEAWDIRLGPAIWRRLIKLFPRSVIENEDKRKIQFYMYSNITNLPTDQFLVLMKEVLSGSEDGKGLLSAMYYDLSMVIDDEEVTEETSHFKNKMKEVMEKHGKLNNDEIDDLLGSLGISIEN